MNATAEKWYVRYPWIIFFLFGLLTVMAAPINLLGTPPNPPSPEAATGLSRAEMGAQMPGILDYIAGISRQLGNFMLAMGVLLMGVAAFPYRQGEKWAWYVSWIVPVLLLIQLANSRGGLGWQADVAFLILAVVALLLPYRKFFHG